ncbi:hypothetical protein [Streptomyces sp. NBC_01353]|uniref:hypothetical protein n=1 Tax=Streptomyces sp. NBC_01353 TaxID=2903835 RepID=UPI002E34B930|nr:hypothetical protein [Streptomyces sp. NBC_01353]
MRKRSRRRRRGCAVTPAEPNLCRSEPHLRRYGPRLCRSEPHLRRSEPHVVVASVAGQSADPAGRHLRPRRLDRFRDRDRALAYREARTAVLKRAQDSFQQKFRDRVGAVTPDFDLPPTKETLTGLTTRVSEGLDGAPVVVTRYRELTGTSDELADTSRITPGLSDAVRTRSAMSFQRVTHQGTPYLVVGTPVTFADDDRASGLEVFAVISLRPEQDDTAALLSAVRDGVVPVVLLAAVLAPLCARTVLRPVRDPKGARVTVRPPDASFAGSRRDDLVNGQLVCTLARAQSLIHPSIRPDDVQVTLTGNAKPSGPYRCSQFLTPKLRLASPLVLHSYARSRRFAAIRPRGPPPPTTDDSPPRSPPAPATGEVSRVLRPSSPVRRRRRGSFPTSRARGAPARAGRGPAPRGLRPPMPSARPRRGGLRTDLPGGRAQSAT